MATLGDGYVGHKRRNRAGIRFVKHICVLYGRSGMSAEMLEVSLLGIITALRLERDARSMVNY